MNNQGQLFFLHGSGSTGKTFVYNTVCAKLRSDDEPIPVEYLRSVNSSSLPAGELNLKIG